MAPSNSNTEMASDVSSLVVLPFSAISWSHNKRQKIIMVQTISQADRIQFLCILLCKSAVGKGI